MYGLKDMPSVDPRCVDIPDKLKVCVCLCVCRTVRACLDLLVPWLHLYIDSQDSGSKAFCDVSLHGPFYASCQAVFYTLIFRHKAILEGNMKKGASHLHSHLSSGTIACKDCYCTAAIIFFFPRACLCLKAWPIYRVWIWSASWWASWTRWKCVCRPSRTCSLPSWGTAHLNPTFLHSVAHTHAHTSELHSFTLLLW